MTTLAQLHDCHSCNDERSIDQKKKICVEAKKGGLSTTTISDSGTTRSFIMVISLPAVSVVIVTPPFKLIVQGEQCWRSPCHRFFNSVSVDDCSALEVKSSPPCRWNTALPSGSPHGFNVSERQNEAAWTLQVNQGRREHGTWLRFCPIERLHGIEHWTMSEQHCSVLRVELHSGPISMSRLATRFFSTQQEERRKERTVNKHGKQKTQLTVERRMLRDNCKRQPPA